MDTTEFREMTKNYLVRPCRAIKLRHYGGLGRLWAHMAVGIFLTSNSSQVLQAILRKVAQFTRDHAVQLINIRLRYIEGEGDSERLCINHRTRTLCKIFNCIDSRYYHLPFCVSRITTE